MQVRSLDWKDHLEWEMATHSSILAWKIPQTEKPRGRQFMESTEHEHTHRMQYFSLYFGFPGGSVVKNLPANTGDESHEHRSLAGYTVHGVAKRELGMSERLSTHVPQSVLITPKRKPLPLALIPHSTSSPSPRQPQVYFLPFMDLPILKTLHSKWNHTIQDLW